MIKVQELGRPRRSGNLGIWPILLNPLLLMTYMYICVGFIVGPCAFHDILSLHLFTYPEIDVIVPSSRLTKPQLVSAPDAGPSNRRLKRSQARELLDL